MRIFANKKFKKRFIIGIIIFVLICIIAVLYIYLEKGKSKPENITINPNGQVLTESGTIEEISNDQIQIKSINTDRVGEIATLKFSDNVQYKKYSRESDTTKDTDRADFQKGDNVNIWYIEQNNQKLVIEVYKLPAIE